MSDDCCNVPAPARTSVYFPDEIILYGVAEPAMELRDYSTRAT